MQCDRKNGRHFAECLLEECRCCGAIYDYIIRQLLGARSSSYMNGLYDACWLGRRRDLHEEKLVTPEVKRLWAQMDDGDYIPEERREYHEEQKRAASHRDINT
jgi:hypothetical protein